MKYKVFLHNEGSQAIEVEAFGEEEALQKASQNILSPHSPEEIRVHRVITRDDIHYDFIMSRLLKPGKVGNWELKFDVVPAGQRVALYDRNGRITIGEYAFDYPLVALTENGNTWMSDSQLEVESYRGATQLAKGNCLVSGLGIGLLPTLIKDKCDSIDIVELNRDVIDLVYPQIKSEKARIIKDDIFHYLDTMDKKYDFIHIDIWGDITAPVLEIEKAREKAERCLSRGGTIWCWLQELYDRIKDRLPKEPVEPGKLGLHEPCLICGNRLRSDYGGLCAICADAVGVSERYLKG